MTENILTEKIFLASSSELKEDRKDFEIFINRKNNAWVDKGVFLKLIVWEDFLDSVSKTRLQDEYNKAIQECDVFVMLFCTKVGPYTEEEFETAFKQFKTTNKPFIFTYFKDAQVSTASLNEEEVMSLLAFKKKLRALGHFYTSYKNIDELKLHFHQQLDKLAASGFIELTLGEGRTPPSGGNTSYANLIGSGAIAQDGGTAIGAAGVYVGGQNAGNINTGAQTNIDTGGGNLVGRDMITHGISPRELESLFAPLLAAIDQHAPADIRPPAVERVEELKAEVAKTKQADDRKIAKIVDGLVGMVPGTVGAVVSMFATPILGGIAGPVTKFVLDKLKAN